MSRTPEQRERRNERERKYRRENPEKVREYERQWKAIKRKQSPDQVREYERQWREANRERLSEYQRQWRAANLDKVHSQRRQLHEQNREKIAGQQRRWNAANPSKVDAYLKRYRTSNRMKIQFATMIRIHGPEYPVVFAEMWAAQDGRCYLCRRELDPGKAHMDHDHRCCPDGASCSRCRRGLACRACNTLVGSAEDDPARLRLIADNLEAALALAAERLAGKPEQMLLGEGA